MRKMAKRNKPTPIDISVADGPDEKREYHRQYYHIRIKHRRKAPQKSNVGRKIKELTQVENQIDEQ